MSTSASRRDTDTPSRFWAKVWVMLLCCCLWRGPVPMVHQHDDQVESEAGSSEEAGQLSRHLLAFHHDCEEKACVGWHLHFVCPWSMTPEGEPDDPTLPGVPPQLLSDAGQTMMEVRGESQSPQMFDVAFHAGAISPLSGTIASPSAQPLSWRARGGFMDSLLQQVPLCAVTGVSLC